MEILIILGYLAACAVLYLAFNGFCKKLGIRN